MDRTPERLHGMKTKYRTSSGVWKERFRQGCLDRLKEQRQSLINTLRKTDEASSPSSSQVNQVMHDEWNKLKLSSQILRSLPDYNISQKELSVFSINNNQDFPEDIEDVLDVFEDIQKELLREEERMLAQYEDMRKFDDQYLCAAIQMLSTDSVMCPVCKKNNLLQNKQVIFCVCGVRVDTQHDSIDLQYVQRQLEECVSSHSCSCFYQPTFDVADLSGVDVKNLIMSCQHCDALAIII